MDYGIFTIVPTWAGQDSWGRRPWVWFLTAPWKFCMKKTKPRKKGISCTHTLGGTRTHNSLIRSQMPYPLGHESTHARPDLPFSNYTLFLHLRCTSPAEVSKVPVWEAPIFFCSFLILKTNNFLKINKNFVAVTFPENSCVWMWMRSHGGGWFCLFYFIYKFFCFCLFVFFFFFKFFT